MDYKSTLNLPKTPFPMRGNLPVKEQQILEFWKQIDLYGKLIKLRIDAPKFILHDGPPYANGNIHLGTALNKILKDIIIKSKFMTGIRSDYVPGWDCHGLPIEHQAEKEMKARQTAMTKMEIRAYCREVRGALPRHPAGGVQEAGRHRRLGPSVCHDGLRLPVDDHRRDGEVLRTGRRLSEEEARLLVHQLPDRARRGGDRVRDGHVALHLRQVPPRLPDGRLQGLPGQADIMLIWTTTPWTLPANLAIAINPDFTYVAVETQDEIYIAVRELVEDIMGKAGITGWRIIGEMSPETLKELNFRHPFIDRRSVVVFADYVAKDVGTGAVHIAPGHGEEDYVTGLEYGLDVYSPVNEKGELEQGRAVLRRAERLRGERRHHRKAERDGGLLFSEEIEHSYPHCWRCKKPVIFRATEQWFVSMEKNGLRKSALDSDRYGRVDTRVGQGAHLQYAPRPARLVHLAPEDVGRAHHHLLLRGVQGALLEPRRHSRRSSARSAMHGADIWFEKDAAYFLPEGAACACGQRAPSSKRRISSTSGSTRAPASPRCSRSGRS